MTAPYAVVFAAAARRAIESDLPEKVASAAVEFVFGALASNPQRAGKPLRADLEGKWSARRGEYRVIYTIDVARNVVEILVIDHRRDVYRRR